MEEIKRINRELKYKGQIVEMYEDTMKLPNGNIVHWDFIKHMGAAAVVPVRADGKIVMVRQYRNAMEKEILEIPAGGLNFAGEEKSICAIRELEEETGYKSDNVEWLINVNTTVAFCNEIIEIFVARDLKMAERNLDENEFVDVEVYSIEELLDMIYTGEITDGKTIAALTAYYVKYCR